MNISTFAKKTSYLVVGTSVLVASLGLITPEHAIAIEECLGTTTHGHGIDPPDTGDCVYMDVYTATDGRIIVQYWGNQDYDFYQLRWSRPGLAERQVEVRGSGSQGSWWALSNAWEDTPYTFKVQACYSGVFGSDCTYWTTTTYSN